MRLHGELQLAIAACAKTEQFCPQCLGLNLNPATRLQFILMKIQGASDSSPTGHGQSVTVKQIGKKKVKHTDIGDFGLVQMEAGAEQGVWWGMQLQVRRREFDPELFGMGQWRGRCGRSPGAEIDYFNVV